MPFHHVTGEAGPAVVTALVVGPRERARVQDALKGRRLLLQLAMKADELRDLVANVDETSLYAVLVEPRDRDGTPTVPLVRALVAERPSVPVIALCDAAAGLSRELLDLARAGAHEVVVRTASATANSSEEEVRALLAAMERGQRTSAGARTLALIAPTLPEDLVGLLELCVYYPNEARSVTSAAQALGVHRKTLVNHCTRAGFPPPGVLLSWCRVLHAAVLLSTSERSVDSIARLLEFQTGSSFRNLFRRYTRLRPTEARGRDGLERVLAVWRKVRPE